MPGTLIGITDADTGNYGATVNSDGSMVQRVSGADGTQAAVIARPPLDNDPGVVVKCSDLADIKELLAMILAELQRLSQ